MSDIKGHKFSQTGHGLSMTFMHLYHILFYSFLNL